MLQVETGDGRSGSPAAPGYPISSAAAYEGKPEVKTLKIRDTDFRKRPGAEVRVRANRRTSRR
jgi:hypothetical protein